MSFVTLASNATLHLPDELAAVADRVLAKDAPGLRVADLQRKAAILEARLRRHRPPG